MHHGFLLGYPFPVTALTLTLFVGAAARGDLSSSTRTTPAVQATAIVAHQGADSLIAIGLLRNDGLLIPLAQLRDTTWETLISDSSSSDTIKVTPAARTLQHATWQAFPFGKRAFPLVTQRLASLPSHCESIEGFRTNAPVQRFDSNSFPMPKQALALVGRGVISKAERLTKPFGAEAALVIRMVDSMMDSYERDSLGATERQFISSLSNAERDRGIRSANVWRHSRSGATVYRFDVERDYRRHVTLQAGKSSITEIIPTISGWIVVSGSRVQLFKVYRTVDDQDRKQAEVLDILGIVTLPDRDVWVAQANGYESEAYALFELHPGRPFRLVASLPAGGC